MGPMEADLLEQINKVGIDQAMPMSATFDSFKWPLARGGSLLLPRDPDELQNGEG